MVRERQGNEFPVVTGVLVPLMTSPTTAADPLDNVK
jgi:hypothetical protein